MLFIKTIAEALGFSWEVPQKPLSEGDLRRLLEYGPLLDKVEAQVGASEPQAAMASIALQRDAANAYNATPSLDSLPVTQERVQKVLGELYLAHLATGEVQYIVPLRAMMQELNLNPSAARLGQQASERYYGI